MNELTVIRSAAEEAILSRYPDFAARQAAWGGPAIARLRQRAFDILKTNGLPTRRVEEWKYTDLRAFMRDFPPVADNPGRGAAEAAAAKPSVLDLPQSHRVMFVDGQDFSAGQAEGYGRYRLSEGGTIPPAAMQALARERFYEGNAAVALNAAFMGDVTVLHVPAGAKLDQPLHLVFRSTGAYAFASFARVLVVVEAGASATIVETHDGPDGVAYQANTLVEIDAADGAAIDHIRHSAGGGASLNLSTFGLHAGKSVRFSGFAMTSGAAMARHQIFATLAGEGSELTLRGVTLLRARQHADTTMVIDHAVGHCTGRELFKSVIDDEARSVFQGKIVVRPDAQKTDGKMAAHALLLSEAAEADAKPELEIFADDVVCGHGATAGALDDDLLFYLRARGIPQKEAEALMVQAFAGEAIETVGNETLRELLTADIVRWLSARG